MVAQLFGVDYYPEQWDETSWSSHAAMMEMLGINTVRLAEFAWSKLEPAAGVYDFDWLDRAIEILASHGIKIILGTPTAAPPIWLIEEHPEILPVNEHGQRASFGMRRHYCPTQPAFHAAVRNIVSAMAEHYHDHPAVFAWQTDNEISTIINGIRCHCDTCRAAFQHWLQLRHGTLEQLNQDWGTIFWSQTYTAWEQIPVPFHNEQNAQGSAHNPGLALDFARFTSDSWVRYQQIHIDILRERCPEHVVTHNLMGLFPYLDYNELVRNLDVVSWDNYPRLPSAWSQFKGMWNASHSALSHDLMRSLKQQSFWVMEQQAGPSGWGTLSPTPLPGELRLWTWQAIARGAAGILYFRWQTSRSGTEQYWHGILPHDGIPGRRYREIKRTGEEILRIGDLATAPLSAEVALLRSYDSLWAFEVQPTAEGLSYDDQLSRYYRTLWRRNLVTDVVSEKHDWSPYKLLIAPCLFVLDADMVTRLHAWVQSGGTLVLTFRSGVKDEHNRISVSPAAGLLRKLAGVHVDDYTTLLPAAIGVPAGGPELLELTLNGVTQRVSADVWMDDLALQGAEVVGRYHGGMYDGSPAVTAHRVGQGRVIYVGTALDDAGLAVLMDFVLEQAGVTPEIASPANVEIVSRSYQGTRHWFILNHSPEPQQITLPEPGSDLLSGQEVSGSIILNGYDVLVVRCF